MPFVEVGFNGYRKPEYFSDTDEWRVQYTGQCNEYTVEVPDTVWILSKAFAFLALVFGGGGALFLWFSTCFVFGPGTWKWAGYEVLFASFFQALSFLWFLTDMCTYQGSTCTLFYGSKSDIVAASFWFGSAFIIFMRYPKPARILNPRRMGGIDREAKSVKNVLDMAANVSNNRDIHLDDATLPNEPSGLSLN